MGRIFLEQMSGARLFNCRECGTNLTSMHELLSSNFTGSTGPALLFNRVINVWHGGSENRNFLTGFHYVRDVRCKICNLKLGWFYEHAHHYTERYKEGKTVLELALLVEVEGSPGESYILFEEETEF